MRGHISKEHTAWCGRCSDWHQFATSRISEFKKEIQKLGWVQSSTSGWLCPQCARERKGGKP